MRQLILGTVLGRIAMDSRNCLDLMKAVFTEPEQAGTKINDQLASRLTGKLCQSNKKFVDVGAHIGSVISSVYDHDSTISIIAIEASPDKADKLGKKFPDIELLQCAVGDAEGKVSFFVNTKHSGFNSLGNTKKGQENIVETVITMKRLDDLISADDVDVIKIDVEGAELGVLRGGDVLISKNRPVIMFESGPPEDNGLGYSKEDIWNWFNERKYDVLVPIRMAHLGPGLTNESFVESHFYPRRTTNYFAVPVERRTEIRNRVRKVLHLK